MKYNMMAWVFWAVFSGGFKRELKNTLDIPNAAVVMKNARKKYKEMLESIQPLGRKTRFSSNLYLASILGSVYISLENKPNIEKMTTYVRESLMNNKILLKSIISEQNFTVEGQESLRREAEISMTDDNPYLWKFTFEPGRNLMEFTTTFFTCGVLYLYQKWNIGELTPAMCRLDYDMAEANNSIFTREQTLAGGGEYCDCHYLHTPKK